MASSQEAALGQETLSPSSLSPLPESSPGCTDANDVLVQHGVDAIKYCIAQAKPLPVDGPFR